MNITERRVRTCVRIDPQLKLNVKARLARENAERQGAVTMEELVEALLRKWEGGPQK